MSSNIWEGKLVRLRAVEPEDWQHHYEWDKDSDMSRALDYTWFPKSKAATQKWAQEQSLKNAENDNFHMQIETLSGQLVGFIGSHSCNLQDGTFSYGVGIHPEHQRKGYAAEAVKLLLRFFFTERRYQKVTANAYSFNEASIWLHEKLGFQLEGRLRRMKYAMGQHHDELHFGMTREEFVGKYLDADNQLK